VNEQTVNPDVSAVGPARGMTVRETLALPAFSHTAVDVLVGDDQLDTPVRWVHVAESARAGHLLRGGELLLATGAGWGTDAAARRALVRDFHTAGAAALVLEIGEYWTSVPPEVEQACRAAGLTLVTTGSEIRFRDVSEQVHSTLLDREVATVEAMREVAETFTTMIVDGAPPQQLIRQAARLLGAPVVLEDPAHRVVYYAVGLEQPSTLLDDWATRSSSWAGAVGRVGTVAEPVRLPGPDAGWCVDVMARGTHWGRLVALGESTPDAGASHVLRQAAMALAVERLGASRPFSWEDLLNRSALDRLTGTLYTTTDGLSEVLAASGFRTRNRSLIALEVRGEVDAPTVRRIADRTGWDVLAAPLTGSTAESGRVSAVVSAPAGGDPLGALRTLADWPGSTVLVSPPQREVGALSRTLRSLGRVRTGGPGVTVVGGTPVSTVIDELRDDVHVRDFAARLLEPLTAYDRRHEGDLVETTAAVLRHPSSRSAVAEDLHLSRTSLYSRIATIERLLGVDLNDGEVQFALGLALRTR
jgi:purine catabolism regulator